MTGDTLENNGKQECNPPPSLPIEVLMYIFQFLHLTDLKCARLVCHSWYEASQDKKLISKEIVNFNSNGATVGSLITDVINSSREFLHFLFKEEEVRWNWPGLWTQFGPRIKSLYIFNCDVRERDFINILLQCESLESMRLSGCRELLMSGGLLRDQEEIKQLQNVLTNLKELVVSHNSYLSDALLNRLMSIAPNLQSLSLEGCQISFHMGLYKKFYPRHSTESQEGVENIDEANDTEFKAMESSSILTFRNILHHINSRSHQLHTLCFSRTLIDSPALTQLVKVTDLQLKSLKLAGCEQLTNTGVVALAEYQSGLKSLDLSCCSRVTDPSMIAICRSLPHLEDLCVRRCRAISNIGVAEVQNLRNLVKLDLSNCDMVTSDGILSGLCNKANSKLRQLYLSGINNMTEDTVVKLAQNLPHLTHLDLGYCITAVTDTALQAIFEHQVSLQYLKLSGCNKITDVGLTGMVVHSSEMASTSNVPISFEETDLAEVMKSRLRISIRSRAEEEIVKDAERKKAILQLFNNAIPTISGKGFSMARLKGLCVLNLSGCSRITDISLCNAFKFLELRCLDLTQCCQITHLGLTALALHNSSLESLVLSMCYSICDDAVEAICKNLQRLRHLDLSACSKLTNASVKSIAKHAKTLRHLDMRRCDRLAVCQDVSINHIPALFLPPAAVDPNEDLTPPPQVPPMPKKK